MQIVKYTLMSNLVHDAEQEFWRPPAIHPEPTEELAPACRRCGTEFMVGAAFCHVCGLGRHGTAVQVKTWTHYFSFLSVLEFSSVKDWFGLPFPALCAFLIGCAFVLVALIQGLRVDQDFEAIQLWRIQWLMAACAAFLAGILLKGRKSVS